MRFTLLRNVLYTITSALVLVLAGCGGGGQAQMPENPKPKPPEGGFKTDSTTTAPPAGQGNAPSGPDAPGNQSSTLPAPPPVTLPE